MSDTASTPGPSPSPPPDPCAECQQINIGLCSVDPSCPPCAHLCSATVLGTTSDFSTSAEFTTVTSSTTVGPTSSPEQPSITPTPSFTPHWNPMTSVSALTFSSDASSTPSSSIAETTSSESSTASPDAVSAPSSAARSTNKLVGPIVGGVIGGLALLGAIILVLLYHKRILQRIRQRHTPPSAEFKNRSFIPSRQYSASAPILDTQGASIYSDDEQPPPPFTPGSFSDPVYEKLSAAAAQREEFFSPYRDAEVGDSKFVGGSSGH